MKPRDADGITAWVAVARTLRLLPGRRIPSLPQTVSPPDGAAKPARPAAPPRPLAKTGRHTSATAIEPGRLRRLERGRDALTARLDLHGHTETTGRAALTDFLLRLHAEGRREALVITGKGARGDGILRRRTPAWLAEPPLRAIVAGVSPAHRRHGGDGALYVALKRAR
ncbi:MAG: Smr/MutS family protein [Caulobacteraceae bacterium]|nr:Smr/MutS family protein [Caulobacteraceae bacterium]